MGACFVLANLKVNTFRRAFLTSKTQRIVEAIFFAFVTSSAFFWMPSSTKIYCESVDEVDEKYEELLVRYNCEEGTYNPLASMFFNEEIGAIRTIISSYAGEGGIKVKPAYMTVYAFTWFSLWILTYGVWVPAGLFLPGIIIGCAVGSIYEEVREKFFMEQNDVDKLDYSRRVVPVLVAVGAMLSAYTRLTYSLVVIMLETTQSINTFVPMLIAIIMGRKTASMFTGSIYEETLKMKKIPILPKEIP